MNFNDRSKEYFLELASSKILPQSYYKSLEYSFFSGGKRVRPKCVELVGAVLGLSSKRLYAAALAVELIHTYSLVHDDLPSMDDDTYRRGKITHHVKYGEASAILAGDTFLTLAFQVLAEHYNGEILGKLVLELSKCSGLHGMVGGQVLDCLTIERSKEIFDRIHYLKTAKLFEYSFVSPGIIAEASETEINHLRDVGKNLGLLFQLQDDLFDEDKKDERLEENILSVTSRADLIQMIEKKKDIIKNNIISLRGFSDNKEFTHFMDKIFSRTY
jgi:geranylgeranyl pyrophosphate synthase